MILPRPRLLDRYLAPWTWLTAGVILHPRGAYLDPAIVAHERVHLREQWGLGAVLALALLPLGWWCLLGLPVGVLLWLALWRWCRPWRLAAEVRGIRAELALTPEPGREALAWAYASDLASPRYHWAARTVDEAWGRLVR